MATRAQLVEAAKDLNQKLDLNPPIDLKAPVSQLQENVKEAAQLLRDEDEVQESTREVVYALSQGEVAAEDAEAPTPAAASTSPEQVAVASPPGPAPARRAGGGGVRPYEGSFAQKCDIASMKGGTIAEIAEGAGTTPGTIRTHFKYRTAKGKWRLDQTGDGDSASYKLVKVEEPAVATA